ncbi:ATP-binding protein [Streptomyces sp. ICN441]|uniref:ATP-binding protein n=1 Tax=Streptomyces sp. ICN441 TaxID=2558286 RepID=UPI0003999AB0|nr:ATP-binding protein [Streptomyces sp. ICN441]
MAPGNTLRPVLAVPRRPDSPVPAIRRFGFELPGRADSVGRARHLIQDRMTRWGIDESHFDTMALVASELFTNAVVHTASRRVLCELHDVPGQLRIAVQDEGCPPGEPRLRRVSAEEGGRGLLLVDAVSSAWGAHDAHPGPGRVVWAELALGRQC